jgi:ABC-type sugar transport system ATPase subunit
VVHQELSLFPGLSIAENIFAGTQPVTRFGRVDWRQLRRRTRDLLRLFDLEHLDPLTPVRDLPPAQCQIVEILKALALEPRVLILDEPTSSLTEAEVIHLFHHIRRLRDERGLSFVYISHHLPEIFAIADRVTVLRDGKLVCERAVADLDEDRLVNLMVGRTIRNLHGQRPEWDVVGEDLFSATGLTAAGRFHDVSFTVRSGEIVALAGLVGAGRTEVGRAVFGADPLDDGEMRLGGRRVAPQSPREAIGAGIAYMTEDRKTDGLFLDASLRDNLVSTHLDDFTGPIPGIMNVSAVEAFAAAGMERFVVRATDTRQAVRNLSGGNQQKVLLGAWMGVEPQLLIVDEPTRGVDVGAKTEIYAQLRQFAARGCGVLMISSDLIEVLGLSDRIVIMKGGTVAGVLDRREATEERVIALAAGAGGSTVSDPGGRKHEHTESA